MTITQTQKKRTIQGASRVVYQDILLDSSYPTGGYAISVASVGFSSTIDQCLASGNGGLVFEPAYQADGSVKLKAMYPGGGATIPAALAVPTTAAGAVAVTSSAATAPHVAGTGSEVANATNLTTITTRVRFEGV